MAILGIIFFFFLNLFLRSLPPCQVLKWIMRVGLFCFCCALLYSTCPRGLWLSWTGCLPAGISDLIWISFSRFGQFTGPSVRENCEDFLGRVERVAFCSQFSKGHSFALKIEWGGGLLVITS